MGKHHIAVRPSSLCWDPGHDGLPVLREEREDLGCKPTMLFPSTRLDNDRITDPASSPSSLSGALRELRKDAVFMSDERDRERKQLDSERMDSQRKFYSELQVQAADLNSGGQGGINVHLKKAFKRQR